MILDKFNRSKFLSPVVIDNVNEFDLVSNTINQFKFNREKRYYRVQEEDIQRPDLIAIKAYRDVEAMRFWWIVCYLNNIMDPWNDININDLLIIPDKRDVEDFLVFNRGNSF